jgi:hypothetical protein
MSGRLDEDLARWEAGELTLPELEDRYPDGDVRELVVLHDRLVDLTAEETPDPEWGWAAMRTRLVPRRTPNLWVRVGRRAHRPAMVAAVAAVLAGGFAFAAEPVRQVVARVLGDVIELIRDGDAASRLASSVKDVSATGKEDTTIRWIPSVKNVDDELTCSTVTSPAHGAVTVVSDCSGGSYTPDSDFNGTDSFTYAVGNPAAEHITATVSITVEPVNDVPVAVDDEATTKEDAAVTVGVLGNDSDVDGDSLTVDSATDGTNGSVATAGNGSVVYTPNPDFHGTDSFTYAVADPASTEPTMATVNITVKPVNDAPVAVDDDATTREDTAVTIDVLGNDSDVDGDSLTVPLASVAVHGSVTIVDDGSITYTPDPDFHGTDSFNYTVADPGSEHIAATVNVTVEPVNDAPAADDDEAITQEDTPVTIDVLGNDSDVEGDPLTVDSATDGTNGTVATAEDGSVTYTPHPDFHGTDSFTYAVADSTGAHMMATVSITVEPVNDAPVADDASMAGQEDTSIPWTPSVGDVDQDVLTCSITTPPAHGEVTVNPDCTGGSYTPEPGYTGTDTIVYEVFDRLATDAATITIEVSPANDPPVAHDVSASGPEDTSIPWTPSVGDADGNALTCTITTPPAHGDATVNPDCSGGSYTPDPNYSGTDSNTYGVSDGGAGDTATLTVEVSPVNDPPTTPP